MCPGARKVLSGVGTQILCPHIFAAPGKPSKDAGKLRGGEFQGWRAAGPPQNLHSGSPRYGWPASPKAWSKRGDLYNSEGPLLCSHRTDRGSHRASHLLAPCSRFSPWLVRMAPLPRTLPQSFKGWS